MCPHYKPAGLFTCVISFPLSPVYLPVCDAQAGKRGGAVPVLSLMAFIPL